MPKGRKRQPDEKAEKYHAEAWAEDVLKPASLVKTRGSSNNRIVPRIIDDSGAFAEFECIIRQAFAKNEWKNRRKYANLEVRNDRNEISSWI